LFAYGTLIFPEVLEAITGRWRRPQNATLPGYARYRLKRHIYPAIIPKPGAAVHGVLYRNLDKAALTALDRFEDTCYERVRVRVMTARGPRPAFAYVLPAARRHLLDEREWDPGRFRARHLARYLARCRRASGAAKP
jgi:gamma-glutamylcyclotransferase (GGCT)/AIG2-like uncharacterized protein YtfP